MTEALVTGRRADSHRRRERVKKALDRARDQGHAVSVASIARAAGVDRSFLYRHPDLLANIHTSQATPTSQQSGMSVTNASLRADLANAQQRIARMAAHNRQLERKLSETLGQQAWLESGLGAAPDIDELQRQVAGLEQRNVALQRQLEEREGELDAARAANRELITALNKTQ
ncbi:DUF6262 family protein [Mycolicibacterium grossiae]|uniref:DUF6262 family protein n=1 Tax=Mycolicibacterium grossiae TaxID=1552759 RepID=UPI0009F18922|nr:DUF6262 family protein [Mycolicibacterium grossiae]